MNRSAALNAAIAAVADRPNQYGKPEQNFERIALLWDAHLVNADYDWTVGNFDATDVAIMLALVKIARLEADPTHADSWIDLAGYAGCGAEVSGAVGPQASYKSMMDVLREADETVPNQALNHLNERLRTTSRFPPDKPKPMTREQLRDWARETESIRSAAKKPAQNSDLVDDCLQQAAERFYMCAAGANCPICKPKTKFGFTVGETVNTIPEPIGHAPGQVRAFGDMHDYAPTSLRHGA